MVAPPGHHFPASKSKKTQGNTGFVLCWDHFRDRFVDRFASKSNLRASVINVHGRGVGLMVVLSVFSERVSNAQTPDVCLQARQWQPSLDKLFPNKLGSWKHFTCYPSIKIHESWELDCACKGMRHSWLFRCRWYAPDAPEIMALDL